MDENLHSIDDLFKKAIEHHDEVPSSKVWENIDKNLDKKNVISITRKYEKWKWVAAALFIFSVGMATYAWNLYNEVVKANKVKTTNAYNQNRKRTNDKNNALDNLVTADEQKQKPSNKIKKSTTATDSASSNNQNTVVKIERKNKQANNSNTNAETPKKDIHTVVKQMPEQLRAKNKRQQIKEPLVAPGNKNDITGKEIKSNFEYAHPNKNVSVEMNSLYNASLSAEKFKVETATVSVPQNLFQVLPPVISSKGLSPVSIKPSAPNIVTKVRGSTKAVKPAKNTVSIFFSTGLVSTHLLNDLQHFREDDRHVIKQNEKRNYAYTTGLLVERNITGNLSILSGLSLAACVTEMNAINLFARPDNRGNVNYRLNSSKGYAYISSKSQVSSINSRPSPGDTVRSLSTTATLQYLSVPAGLRYHLNKGKFSFNPAIAFSANFVTKKKIETVLFVFGRDEKTTTRDIQGVKPAYFDGSFRTDLSYNVNRTIGISLIPSARFALSSITKDGPVKTYVNTFGLGLGLNVHF